jgi:transglutaminase-like putative cysteine protease
MVIKIGFDIGLRLFFPTTILYVLRVHHSRRDSLIGAENFRIEPAIPFKEYPDLFGNLCGQVTAPAGVVHFLNEAIVHDPGELDTYVPEARSHNVSDLPSETLTFLLPSRYCEVDSELLEFAWRTFSSIPEGWGRVQAICDFVHGHLEFDYGRASARRTALIAFHERVGVCRDFAHLAITLCRCLNIPARYATGYLGDIGVPPVPYPMDFSAWFEAYIGGQWHTFDPRHNCRRIGRILVGRGRDAADVPITMAFGTSNLETFTVVTEELEPNVFLGSASHA